MARRGIKKKDHERLDDTTVGRVVSLLEQDNPITKKAACEHLNISYNTKRLDRIIEEYKEKQDFIKKRFAMNKGKSFSDIEIKELVTDYLNGESIAKIADNLFRSTHVVKRKMRELNLPVRNKDCNYFNPDMLPDEAISENFSEGELVWSSRYNAVAEIRGQFEDVYRIFVFGKHNQFAYQPWYELGKLEVIERFGLTVDKFIKTEKPNFAYRVD